MENFEFKMNEKYIPQYNYLIYCHNILVEWIKWADKNNINQFEIELDDSVKIKEFQTLTDEKLFKWLRDNGYENELYEMNRRHPYHLE